MGLGTGAVGEPGVGVGWRGKGRSCQGAGTLVFLWGWGLLEPSAPSPAAVSHPLLPASCSERICARGLKGLNIVLIEAFKADFTVSLLLRVTDVPVNLFQTCCRKDRRRGEDYFGMEMERREVSSGPVGKKEHVGGGFFLPVAWCGWHATQGYACHPGLAPVSVLLWKICWSLAAVRLQGTRRSFPAAAPSGRCSPGHRWAAPGRARPLLPAPAWGARCCSQPGGCPQPPELAWPPLP